MSEETKTDMTRPVVEMMQQGMAIMRVENDSLQAMAIQRPRDVAALANKAIAELRAFPEFAKKAYYSIPYKDRTSGKEETVFVEGPSIKAANAMVRHWGNNSSGFRIVGADEERVNIQGVFVDHETGMRRTAEISVSRIARKKDGTYYPLAADRLNMAIQAGGSKAVRNAILNALPIGFVEMYFEESKRIAARGGKAPAAETGKSRPEDISAEMEQTYKAFENLGVARQEVASYVTAHPGLGDEEAIVAHLIGVLNAIQEGQVSPEEIFTAPTPPLREPQAAATTAPGVQTAVSRGAKPPVPGQFRPMASKIDGGTCTSCGKAIAKGEEIYYDPTAKRAHHRDHFA